MKINPFHIAILALLSNTSTSQASLNIDLTFDYTGANNSSLFNDAWSGSTSLNTKKPAFESAIRAAADRWESAFSASTKDLSYTIAVSWAAKSGGTLAAGGPTWNSSNNEIISATLVWDNDGSSKFFLDTSVSSNSEWTKYSSRSMNFGAGNVNVERVYYNATTGAERDYTDLYSVALHEIGHTIGFVSSYPKFTVLDADSDGDLDLSDGSQIAYSGGHSNISISTPEYTTPDPYLFPHTGSSIGSSYNPMLMSPSVVAGIRRDLSAADIQIVADIQGFDNVDFSPVPEPSSSLLIGLGSIALILRRRKQ